MTQFIADLSHYDGTITPAIARAIKADGIAAVTHKIGEGMGGDDTTDATSLASLRDAGFELLGGYGVPRSGNGVAQARSLIALADRDEPWWHTFPGWFWQVDLERWSYDAVPASVGRAYADELAKTGRRVIVYASKGQYGDQLTGWPYPLWNARYPSTRQAPYRQLYPGDAETSASGWQRYSGQMPALWQYASSATVGGLTTTDISAFRGTYDQLRALLAPSPQAHVESITSGGRMYLAIDTDQGSPTVGGVFLVMDDRKSHHISDPALVSQLVSLHQCGAITLGTDNGVHPDWWRPWSNAAGQEVPGMVLTGWRAEVHGELDAGTVPAVDVDALAAKVAAALVASNTNGLTAADHAAVVEDVKAAMRAGTGT